MSKRLQVLIPDDEYRAVVRTARRRGRPVAEIVRESLRKTVSEQSGPNPADRIAAVLRFARFEGPTGEIDRLLLEIERGRNLT